MWVIHHAITWYHFAIPIHRGTAEMATADDLRDIDPLLSMEQVRQLVPLSASHIYRLLKKQRFAPVVRLGDGPRSRVAFRKSQILGYLADPSNYYAPGYYDDDFPNAFDEAF